MMTDTTVETAMALVEAFNKRDMSIWENATSADLAADYPGAHGLNKDAARGYNLSFLNCSDDIHFDVENVIASGSQVVIQCQVAATFDHPLVTPQGTIPPTGKSGDRAIPFAMLVDVEDGK